MNGRRSQSQQQAQIKQMSTQAGYRRADEDDINLMTSQTSPRHQQMAVTEEEDDMRLFLSQSQQRGESSLSDLAESNHIANSAENVKLNVERIGSIIKLNQQTMLSQNIIVMNLIGDISISVSEISERVKTLENKFNKLSLKADNNAKTVAELNKSVNSLKKMQRQTEADHEKRLKHIETVLSSRQNEGNTEQEIITIHNLSYQQKDVEDVNTLLRDGLGMDIQAKAIHRAPSKFYNAGILTVELSSQKEKSEVMKNKRKLRHNNNYVDVYIDSLKMETQTENNFHTMIQNMHNQLFSVPTKRSYNPNNANRSYRY